jgi:voltage-gated potassium channel
MMRRLSLDEERRQRASESLERATELPMLLLALAIVPLVLIPLFFDLPRGLLEALFAFDWLIWAIFALELAARTYLAPRRIDYLRRHWFDVVIVALPFLRPLRIVQSARLIRLLRLARAIAAGARVYHSVSNVLDAHGLKYVLLLSGLIILAAGGLISLIETRGDGPIGSFEDGLWWAITTVTTVGYGDKFPVTPEGRAVAVFLMVLGITLFSVLTANIAAFLVQPRSSSRASLDDVVAQLNRLEARLEALSHQSADRDQPDEIYVYEESKPPIRSS